MDDLKYRMTGRKELDLTYTRSQHYDDKENKTNKKIEKKHTEGKTTNGRANRNKLYGGTTCNFTSNYNVA